VGAGPNQTRHPIHRAKFVEDRAADTRSAVGFKLDPAFEIEGSDGIHQAKDPGGHKIIKLHLIGKLYVNALGVVTNEVQVVLHQHIPQCLGLGFLVFNPNVLDFPLRGLGHTASQSMEKAIKPSVVTKSHIQTTRKSPRPAPRVIARTRRHF